LLYVFFWVIPWGQGITQKKAYNIQNTVKVWNPHIKFIYLSAVGYIMKVSIAQILCIQWLVKNELENMCKETVVVILRYSPDLVLVKTSSFWDKI
jgi:ABC-type arginine transport system permease subunit